MPVRNRIAELHPDLTEWRHHLHAHPELLYNVEETAGFVVDRLKEFGIADITTGIGKTGVVATIKGRSSGSGKVIGLRADMDALPITEATGLPYASTVPGKMHACGHDGHTTMLLGAAKYLSETRNFDGTVVLIFQPAEEGGAGGKAMCDDGLMERWGIQEVYGMHNMPGLATGQFATRPGPLLASSDEFEIRVTGKGGHAAAPHETVDTTLVASQMVVSLHSIVSRNVDPIKRVVLTVGTFETDSSQSNIIAHTATLTGTVRTLDPEYRLRAEEAVRRVVEGTAASFGATAEVIWTPGYPVTINTPDETAHALDAAKAVSAHVIENVDPIMPSEDFAYMLEQRPGAYMFVGNGDTAMCHHPSYEFDDDLMPAGVSWFAEIVERRMPAA
ncbi:M20 aminoacylase family protein [Nioella nitratireducens]|uniref:M20 aminoacylase family protein n=1 Tax=Nioella nitratireducens TaxID=1287720 RepID=UPI0008FD007E|nr:M20 aminoacylase family protein [Nioella nitratireducens]